MRHYTGHPVAFAFLPECVARLSRNIRLTPLAGGFREHLDGGCPDHLASERCHLNTTLRGNMGTQKVWRTKLMHFFLGTT
jgi:hypothetical protein